MSGATFGRAISDARKSKEWSLRELASRIRHEDGTPISQQYLNDIEHDRRSPSSDHLVQQFAAELGLDKDWLYFLAGKFPEDVRGKNIGEADVTKAMQAFRKTLPKRKGST
jgi:transcriptional regulator with XRE-family HTH domain